jgi:TfoX/Sxy family transcriptional regulator of competence genes
MTPSPPGLVRIFDRAVRPLAGTTRRKMFGYPALCVRGNMFAGLVRDRMILRLGEEDRRRFLEREGATPFVAMGRPMKQWAVVPPALVESPARLRPWLRRALAHGRALPPKPARRVGRCGPSCAQAWARTSRAR